jgi:hypothetical protein
MERSALWLPFRRRSGRGEIHVVEAKLKLHASAMNPGLLQDDPSSLVSAMLADLRRGYTEADICWCSIDPVLTSV